MTNHELLDMIGEVNEDYVLAADSNVARPRFRWKTLAACAACAALIVAAYPISQALRARNATADSAFADKDVPLHTYTLVEGGGADVTAQSDVKVPAGGADTLEEGIPESIPGTTSAAAPALTSGTYVRGEDSGDSYEESGRLAIGSDTDCAHYNAPGQDATVQDAAEWYDALLRTYRLEKNPEWYGGAWIAGDRLLAVAIVDGFRTPELEAELTQAAGTGAVLQFSTVKYSMEFLNGLMEPAVRALDGSKLSTGVGVDVMANCLGVDLYSDGQNISDDVLAALAHLDPDGDAIRVRVFTGALSAMDEIEK